MAPECIRLNMDPHELDRVSEEKPTPHPASTVDIRDEIEDPDNNIFINIGKTIEDSSPPPSWLLLIWIILAVVLALVCVEVVREILYLYNSIQRHQNHLAEWIELRRLSDNYNYNNNDNHNDNHNDNDNDNHYNNAPNTAINPLNVTGLPQVERDNLELGKALGHGEFGQVYQGQYRRRAGDTAGTPVAVKMMVDGASTEQAEKDLLMEATIMNKFDHPNIVQLIGVSFEQHPNASDQLVLDSKSPSPPEKEDSQFPHLLKASQDCGSMSEGASASEGSVAETRTTQLLPASSTDGRFLSSTEDEYSSSEVDDKPVIRETSFIEKPDAEGKQYG